MLLSIVENRDRISSSVKAKIAGLVMIGGSGHKL